MLLDGFTESLTGLEAVDVVGWPYRGTMITSEVFAAGAPTSSAIESATIGQPALGSAYIREASGHHAIRQVSAPIGWDYWFMHSRHYQATYFHGSPAETKYISGDQLGMWCKNPARHNTANQPPFLNIGAPLKVGSQVIRVDCYATQAAGELIVSIDGFKSAILKNYPVNPVADVYYATGHVSSNIRPVGLRKFSEIVNMPVEAWRYRTRIHGFYENKILLSVGVDNTAARTDSGSGYTTCNSISWALDPNYRTPQTDYSQHTGWIPFLVLELTVSGVTDEEISLDVVHGWSETAGTISRSTSPDCKLEQGVCLLESHQTNAVLDVFYNDAGVIQTVYGDFDFSSESHRYVGSPPIGSHNYYNLIRYTLKHRYGTESRQLDYTREVTYRDRSDGPGKIYNYTESLNGETLVDVEKIGDWGDRSNQVFTRAPYAGAEIRTLTMPWLYYSEKDPITNISERFMTPARTFASITGRHCVSLFASQDSADGTQSLKNTENTKTVSHWSVCHNHGFLDMAGFSALVDPNDNDWRPPSAASAILFGYAGAKTLAPVNPVTGVVVTPPTNRPASWVNYL